MYYVIYGISNSLLILLVFFNLILNFLIFLIEILILVLIQIIKKMAYDEHLADRIHQVLEEKKIAYTTKKMFGGLAFMVDAKMCIGIVKGELMARIGTDAYESALSKDGCKKMNFTGREMKGYVFVNDDGYDLDEDLAYWIQLALDFNPLAKASKKRTKKRK